VGNNAASRQQNNDEYSPTRKPKPYYSTCDQSLSARHRFAGGTLDGRFPPNRASVSKDLVAYLAKQLNVPPKVFDQYDWGGPSIRQHRAQIRQWLGFRPYEEADRPALIEWLRFHVLPKNQNLEFLIETADQHLRVKRIEPPTRSSIERIIRSN